MSTGPPNGNEKEARAIVMQLSKLTDLVGLEVFITKRTPKGKSSHSDPWGYTREALATYSPGSDPKEVIRLFEQAGVNSDVEAVRWIIRNDKLIS
jgi:hypothetical protein